MQEGWDLGMSLLPSGALDVPLAREFLSVSPKAVKISLHGLDQGQLFMCVYNVLLNCSLDFPGNLQPPVRKHFQQ